MNTTAYSSIRVTRSCTTSIPTRTKGPPTGIGARRGFTARPTCCVAQGKQDLHHWAMSLRICGHQNCSILHSAFHKSWRLQGVLQSYHHVPAEPTVACLLWEQLPGGSCLGPNGTALLQQQCTDLDAGLVHEHSGHHQEGSNSPSALSCMAEISGSAL